MVRKRPEMTIASIVIVAIFLGIGLSNYQSQRAQPDSPTIEAGLIPTPTKMDVQPVDLVAQAKEIKAERAARAKAEKERAKAEKAARLKEESDRLASDLTYEFGFDRSVTELKLAPGAEVPFYVKVTKNGGPGSLEGLKFLVQPRKYLKVKQFQELGLKVFPDAMTKRILDKDRKLFNQLTRSGFLLRDNHGGKVLFSQNDPYHEVNEFKTWIRGGEGRQECGWFAGHLILDPKLKPGQDIPFEGFLIAGERRVPLGTLVLHVMYPS